MNTSASLFSWQFLLAVLFLFVFNFTHGEYDFIARLYMKQQDGTTRIGTGSFIRKQIQTQNETKPAIIITSKENLENCIIEDSFVRISTIPINFGIDFWYNNDSLDIGILSLEFNEELFDISYQNITIADKSIFGYNMPKEGKIIGYMHSTHVVLSIDTYLLSSEQVYDINGGKNWANKSDQETNGYINTAEDLITTINYTSIICKGLNGAPIVVENNGKFIQYGMLRSNFEIVVTSNNQSNETLFGFNVGPVLVGSNITWKACTLCTASSGLNTMACVSCSQGLTNKAVGLTHHVDNDHLLSRFQLDNNSWLYNPEECSVFDILLNDPTNQPTQVPTKKPTVAQIRQETHSPTKYPTYPTGEPTHAPTPTASPTPYPTQNPTRKPTQAPTKTPTQEPTEEPTEPQ